jgi:hypothetical protein
MANERTRSDSEAIPELEQVTANSGRDDQDNAPAEDAPKHSGPVTAPEANTADTPTLSPRPDFRGA